ncbi:hypothetical protein [Photorhabdus heterorhabditis]|nr:hypothetical protein [Photorhabdus heterorhabditis]
MRYICVLLEADIVKTPTPRLAMKVLGLIVIPTYHTIEQSISVPR